MPSYYRFHFVGAEIPCDPSPGATDLYAGPYYCWYPSPSTDRVAAAHATLDRFLDAHGPFQLVMGFSQVIFAQLLTVRKPLHSEHAIGRRAGRQLPATM